MDLSDELHMPSFLDEELMRIAKAPGTRADIRDMIEAELERRTAPPVQVPDVVPSSLAAMDAAPESPAEDSTNEQGRARRPRPQR